MAVFVLSLGAVAAVGVAQTRAVWTESVGGNRPVSGARLIGAVQVGAAKPFKLSQVNRLEVHVPAGVSRIALSLKSADGYYRADTVVTVAVSAKPRWEPVLHQTAHLKDMARYGNSSSLAVSAFRPGDKAQPLLVRWTEAPAETALFYVNSAGYKVNVTFVAQKGGARTPRKCVAAVYDQKPLEFDTVCEVPLAAFRSGAPVTMITRNGTVVEDRRDLVLEALP